MGDRQKTRLAERRKRQRRRLRARTERVKARNQRAADVAAATGTRAGERWANTVDNVVDEAAEFADNYLDRKQADDPGVDLAADAIEDGAGQPTPPPSSSAGFDPVGWATENPVAAGLVGLGVLGAIGYATGAIKLK